MAYTVKKLSELSGVTVRTLHYYEEEELLKPAYYGSNGYRYYEEKELLHLQQILFFKELGFTIKQIKKVLQRERFDLISALYSHRKLITQERERLGKLIETIDTTIKHLKGEKKMKEHDVFDGFRMNLVEKSKENASYAQAEELVYISTRNPTKEIKDVEERGVEFYLNLEKKAYAFFQELAQSIDEDKSPESPEVQSIIQGHHAFTDDIHNATKDVYIALAQLYKEHPEFRKQLDIFHLKLADFMSQAMLLFAERKL